MAPDFVELAQFRRTSCAVIGLGMCSLSTLFARLVARLVASGWRVGFLIAFFGDLARTDELFGFVAACHFSRAPLQSRARTVRLHPNEAVCRDGRVCVPCL